MNIAGGLASVQEQAARLGVTANDVAQAARGTACYFAGGFSTRASAARAETLGVRSHVTGLPDGPAMQSAGGLASLQEQAARLGVPAIDVAQSAHQTAGYLGTITSALANSGRRNPNMSQHGNPDAVRLGEEIGVFVMGQAEWAACITTPSNEMGRLNRPSGRETTWRLAAHQSSREGWVFRPSTLTAAPWTMTDMVTFVLPDNTEENPSVVTKTLRDAISEAYHVNWRRYRTATLKKERDKDADMKLSRSRRH